jgi:hypothetical protein
MFGDLLESEHSSDAGLLLKEWMKMGVIGEACSSLPRQHPCQLEF